MSASAFKDHFSRQSAHYARHRPLYPQNLFTYLAKQCWGHDLAWDVATGNGQAASALAHDFAQVFASDASSAQIKAAKPHPNITYQVEPAEQSSLPDASVDLVTVAQAIHWLDHQKFYTEVKRVLKPGGVLAAWVYALHRISPDLDPLIRYYYEEVVGAFWPPERKLVEEKLQSLDFPFQKIAPPDLEMEAAWEARAVLSYLSTWSASQRYQASRGEDPIQQIEADFLTAWGDPQERREVRWPLYFCIGRKD